jgi:outer membrane protein with beta-barrel domain
VEVHVKRSVQVAAVWIFIAIVAGAAAPASAQTRATRNMDASIGYQMLHIPDETFPVGFNVDVSGAMKDRWRLVGELGWAMDEQNEPGVSGDLNFFHFGAGPRLVAPMRGVQPFAQLLAGLVHTRADLIVNGTPLDDNDWAFMLQPGVGVNIPAGKVVNVFGQADYRRGFFKEEGDNEFRLSFGIRFSIR